MLFFWEFGEEGLGAEGLPVNIDDTFYIIKKRMPFTLPPSSAVPKTFPTDTLTAYHSDNRFYS